MKLKTKKQQLYLEKVIRLHQEKGYGEAHISRILPIGLATVSRWIAIKLLTIVERRSRTYRRAWKTNVEYPDTGSREAATTFVIDIQKNKTIVGKVLRKIFFASRLSL